MENETGLSDHDAMLEIQQLMDGVEWNADTLTEIASVLERSGYDVRDIDD